MLRFTVPTNAEFQKISISFQFFNFFSFNVWIKQLLQFERQKQARENKKKEDAATLEDINEQIRRTEHKLDELKKEKTTLFTTLKR